MWKLTLKMRIERLGLKPSFDEVSIALMFISGVLIYVLSQEMREEITLFIHSMTMGTLFHLAQVLIFGAIFTFVGFRRKMQRTYSQRRTMVIAALWMNFFAVLSSFIYLVKETPAGYYALFPALNILIMFLILVSFLLGFYEEWEIFKRERAEASELLVGFLSVAVIALVTLLILHFHWSAAFSMSVAYASYLGKVPKIFNLGKKR